MYNGFMSTSKWIKDIEEKLGIVTKWRGRHYSAYCKNLSPGAPTGFGDDETEAKFDLLARLMVSHITILKRVRELMGEEGFEENVRNVFILKKS